MPTTAGAPSVRTEIRTRPEIDVWLLTDVVTRLRRVLRASIRSEYSWESLPMAQVEIMQRLRDEPGIRVQDLAQRHRLAKNTVSVLVRQLVTADLVSRSPDPVDRRAASVRLTSAGEQMLADWQRAHESRFAIALAHLSDLESAVMQSALPVLCRLVDELETADAAVAHDRAPDSATPPRR